MSNRRNGLITDIETAVRKILTHENKDGEEPVTVADKLKAAEIGAKIVLAKHRVKDTDDQSFFSKGQK